MKYLVGDKVVFAGHGVCRIRSIRNIQVGDKTKEFYILQCLINEMTIIQPIDSPSVRSLSDKATIDKVKKILTSDLKVETATWYRRYRNYMEYIKTGDLVKIATVLRSLQILRDTRDLSFGERKMLDQCQILVDSEIEALK